MAFVIANFRESEKSSLYTKFSQYRNKLTVLDNNWTIYILLSLNQF